jgi:hypothetical protein
LNKGKKENEFDNESRKWRGNGERPDVEGQLSTFQYLCGTTKGPTSGKYKSCSEAAQLVKPG